MTNNTEKTPITHYLYASAHHPLVGMTDLAVVAFDTSKEVLEARKAREVTRLRHLGLYSVLLSVSAVPATGKLVGYWGMLLRMADKVNPIELCVPNDGLTEVPQPNSPESYYLPA